MTLAAIETDFFVMAIAGMGFVLVIVGGIFWYSWHDERRKREFKLLRERETTHRELAAYVAEGSITADEAEKLIRAMGETDGAITNARREAEMAAASGAAKGKAGALA
jgi:hypothetical protein